MARYKEGKGLFCQSGTKNWRKNFKWLREFISLSDDIKDGDAKEYYDSFLVIFLRSQCLCLTPGKIVEPNGSTPVNFAYRIHEVGHHTKLVRLSIMSWCLSIQKLNTQGDVCNEIKTNKQSPLDQVKVEICRTAGARNKIRTFLKKKLKLRKIRLKMVRKNLKR